MPSMNISEVDSILLDSEMKTQQVSKAIEPFIDSIIAFDFEYSILCAALKKRYQTFSFISWG